MNIALDLHTHTLVSTHAFSTMGEMIAQAKQLGLQGMAVTDHGIGTPDSPHEWHFSCLPRLPDILPDGFWLLKGVEANAMDAQGTLDMPEKIRKNLDWVIVSLHTALMPSLTFEEATALWLRVAETPYVDMIGHSEQKEFYYDYDLVTKAFAKHNKVVEFNANSPIARKGNEKNMRELAFFCKKNGAKVAVNSDAHSIYDLGNYENVLPILREVDFPEERVVNRSVPRFLEELKLHGRKIPVL